MSDAFDAAFGSDATSAASFPEGGESSTLSTPVLSGGGGGGGDEDPAAAFLAQQESEMAGIEGMAEGADGGGGAAAMMMMMGGGVMEGDVGGVGMEGEGFGILDSGEVPHNIGGDDFDLGLSGDLNGDIYKDANGPSTAAGGGGGRGADLPPAPEPESLRRWRHEQRERLDQLDAASRKAECEWRERAKKELEEWRGRQGEQLEKTRRNNRAAEEACVREREEEEGPGSEWERVARLCDFNPKTSKQTKDVSRMRSIIISLKQSPLVR